MPVSYGQSNIPAPSFMDSLGQGLGGAMPEAIQGMIQKIQDKKQMDQIMQGLQSDPKGQQMLANPLFKIMAAQGPKALMQAILAGRLEPEKPQVPYSGLFPEDTQAAAGPITKEGKGATAPAIEQKGTLEEMTALGKAREGMQAKKEELKFKQEKLSAEMALKDRALTQKNDQFKQKLAETQKEFKIKKAEMHDKLTPAQEKILEARYKGFETQLRDIEKRRAKIQDEIAAKIQTPESAAQELSQLDAQHNDLASELDKVNSQVDQIFFSQGKKAAAGRPAAAAWVEDAAHKTDPKTKERWVWDGTAWKKLGGK